MRQFDNRPQITGCKGRIAEGLRCKTGACFTCPHTLENSAIGAMLDRWRRDWWSGPPTWEPAGVRYRTSFHGLPKKDGAASDDHWIVELAIPLRNFSHDAAHTPPHDGDEWRLNLMRTGGITNRQQSTWSRNPPPSRSFHAPTAFGRVRFVNQTPPR